MHLLAGTNNTTRRERSSVVGVTEESRQNDESTKTRLEVEFEGGDVVVRGTELRVCDRVEVTTTETVALEENRVHPLLILGAEFLPGALAVGYGVLAPRATDDELRNSNIALLAGTALILAGGIDFLWNVGSRSVVSSRTSEELRMLVSGEPCGSEPASNLEVMVDGRGNSEESAGITLNGDGVARLSVTDPPLSELTYDTPFGRLSCPQCLSSDIVLPTGSANAHVLHRRQLDELRLWLEHFDGKFGTTEVKQEVARLEAEAAALSQAQESQKKERLHAALHDAREAARSRKWGVAYRHASECEELDGCREIADRTRSPYAGEFKRAAAKALKAGKPFRAVDELVACEEAVGRHPECSALLKEVTRGLILLTPIRVEDFAVLRKPSGYEVYFSLVNAAGTYIAPPGDVKLILEFTTNGSAGFMPNEVSTFEVSESDYTRGTIGIARKSTLVVSRLYSFDHMRDVSKLGIPIANYVREYGTGARMRVEFTIPTGTKVTGMTDFFP